MLALDWHVDGKRDWFKQRTLELYGDIPMGHCIVARCPTLLIAMGYLADIAASNGLT
jgi:hypothetical protein